MVLALCCIALVATTYKWSVLCTWPMLHGLCTEHELAILGTWPTLHGLCRPNSLVSQCWSSAYSIKPVYWVYMAYPAWGLAHDATVIALYILACSLVAYPVYQVYMAWPVYGLSPSATAIVALVPPYSLCACPVHQSRALWVPLHTFQLVPKPHRYHHHSQTYYRFTYQPTAIGQQYLVQKWTHWMYWTGSGLPG